MYKQLIIARQDLNMSPGKLAAQVAHGSMAFLKALMQENMSKIIHSHGPNLPHTYEITFPLDVNIYEQWFEDVVTKVVLQAKNCTELVKAISLAEEEGLRLGKDLFPIYDVCRTGPEPEGPEGTLTVVGFRPLYDEVADKIGRKFHLYSGPTGRWVNIGNEPCHCSVCGGERLDKWHGREEGYGHGQYLPEYSPFCPYCGVRMIS